MIQRPTHLSYLSINIEFNQQYFSELEVDLNHINKDGRSQYKTEDLENALVMMIDKKTFSSSATKAFGSENCTYYVVRDLYNDQPYKLVLCICSDKPKTLGVITFHREAP